DSTRAIAASSSQGTPHADAAAARWIMATWSFGSAGMYTRQSKSSTASASASAVGSGSASATASATGSAGWSTSVWGSLTAEAVAEPLSLVDWDKTGNGLVLGVASKAGEGLTAAGGLGAATT